MVKVYQLFIGSKAVGSSVYKSKSDALKIMQEINEQKKDYNRFIQQQKLDREPKKLITSVKEISFSRKSNVFG